jgi:hypothetical protein
MALSDLAVFSEYTRSAMTEVLSQNVELFNQASDGTLVLRTKAHTGDYSEQYIFGKVSGLVRRRDAYGSGAVSGVHLTNLIERSVKVAAGTPPVEMNPGQFAWIQQNPQEAGAALGQQMAAEMLGDMVNVALGAAAAAINNVGATVLADVTAATTPADLSTFVNLNTASMLFGDRADAVRMWAMHSKSAGDLYANALTNTEKLFVYSTVNVLRDPFGRRFVVTDSANLVVTGSPNKYRTLGLVNGAVLVDDNGDFDENIQTINGNENINRTYQAEWSYNVGLKGYQWDSANGGKSPTNSALFTGTNWDKFATSIKDTAGVMLLSH